MKFTQRFLVFPLNYPRQSGGLTQRAPDWWESARFQAFSLAQSWFRQNGVISSRPPAGNASRWVPVGKHKHILHKLEQIHGWSQAF
jgi:hypothetical protein